MKESLKFWNLLPWLLIILGSLLLAFRLFLKNKSVPDRPATTVEDVEEVEDEPSKEQRIVNHFKIIRDSLPAQYSDDVVKMLTAQAMHESANFTSRLYKEQNNMFGMRHPSIRKTLSLRDETGYATFATLADSAGDLELYFKEFNMPAKYANVAAYVKLINKNGYFEDNYITYFNAVRSHYNKVKSLVQ